MELGESGAKPRDICAVLRHEMLFLQGVYSYTAWRNSFFLHGFARVAHASPRWFDWFAQPALDTGSPNWACFCMFLHAFGVAPPFDYTLQPVDFSLCLITGSGFSSPGSPSGPAQRVWGGGLSVFKYCLAHGGVGLGTGPPNGLEGFWIFKRRVFARFWDCTLLHPDCTLIAPFSRLPFCYA